MTRSQALAKAVRLWGKKAAVRDDGKPTSDAGRAVGRAEAERIKALPADQQKALSKERSYARSTACHYQYSVGHIMVCGGMFSAFVVEGQGDSWEAAFAKATKK